MTATATPPNLRNKLPGRSFAELSPTAKKRAREWWREQEHYDFDNDRITEMFSRDLCEYYGIGECEVHWCQFEGVAFDCRSIDLDNWAAHERELNEENRSDELAVKLGTLAMLSVAYNMECPSFRLSVESDDRYCYPSSLRVDFESEFAREDDNNPGAAEIIGLCHEIGKWCENRIKDIAYQLAKDLDAELNYLDSDEYIDEHLEANDYRFRHNGEFLE